MNKVAYKAISRRRYMIRFMWHLGIGYERQILNRGGSFIAVLVTIYLPMCALSAVQRFERAN